MPSPRPATTFVPHKPARPEKAEGGQQVRARSDYEPAGDQPTAISELAEAARAGETSQVLLGVTGSGKTFTMAKVIETLQRPALILAPNKILAAQLYGEFKSFFPDNAVEFFVSYYDYYQPEAYVPRTDTYIEKESSVNEAIDRMRHSATRSLLERDDVIIVASVSCLYGIGSVETYSAMVFSLKKGAARTSAKSSASSSRFSTSATTRRSRAAISACKGDNLEIFPSHYEDTAWRVSFFGDEIEEIVEFDPLTGKKVASLDSVKVYANSHYVTPGPTLKQAMGAIRHELDRAAEGAGGGGQVARAAADRAAHQFRPRDDRRDRLLRGYRELLALPYRPPARRAAADPVRISARQCACCSSTRATRRCRRSARWRKRRSPAEDHARRIRLPPAELHRQPPAALQRMGRDAPADDIRLGDARARGR